MCARERERERERERGGGEDRIDGNTTTATVSISTTTPTTYTSTNTEMRNSTFRFNNTLAAPRTVSNTHVHVAKVQPRACLVQHIDVTFTNTRSCVA